MISFCKRSTIKAANQPCDLAGIKESICLAGRFSNIHYGDFIDLVAVYINYIDKPAAPIPSLHDIAVFEVTREGDRIIAGGSIARQINTFVIFQDCRTVRETKIVAWHQECSLLTSKATGIRARVNLLAAITLDAEDDAALH